MRDAEITIGQTLWVALDQDDMYGAESGTDSVIKARVTAKDVHYVTVVDTESDDDFQVEREQCFANEAEARAAA